MRIPLEAYLQGKPSKVYSLVAAIPFSPLDIDLSLLARGEWDGIYDRFRIWYLPKAEGQNGKTVCYVMIRKADWANGVLIYAHIVVNLERGEPDSNFTLGILSNDEIRARSVLGAILGIPPIFHKRSEITLVERRWRSDPEVLGRFAANVYSATATLEASAAPSGEVYQLKIEAPSSGFTNKVGVGLDTWWDKSTKVEASPISDDEPGTPQEDQNP